MADAGADSEALEAEGSAALLAEEAVGEDAGVLVRVTPYSSYVKQGVVSINQMWNRNVRDVRQPSKDPVPVYRP